MKMNRRNCKCMMNSSCFVIFRTSPMQISWYPQNRTLGGSRQRGGHWMPWKQPPTIKILLQVKKFHTLHNQKPYYFISHKISHIPSLSHLELKAVLMFWRFLILYLCYWLFFFLFHVPYNRLIIGFEGF